MRGGPAIYVGGMCAQRFIVDGLARLPQFAHGGWAGDLLHVAGTLGTTEGMILADGVAGQTVAALDNMARILAEAGLGWDDVAKVDVFLADMVDSPAYNAAYGDYFADRLPVPPARITVGGCQLALDARIEMQCVAERPRPRPPVAGSLPARRALTVAHDGEELAVEVIGEGGTPLILSHGAGGNRAVWIDQVAHFATDRTVVVWDHRGFGRSTDRAGRSGPDVAVGDLLAICDELELGPVDLVGQSMGGWTALGAALARPGLARSVVLADSLGGVMTDAVAAALGERAVDLAAPDTLGLHPALDPSLARRDPARALLYQQLGTMGSAHTPTIIERLFATTHTSDDLATLGCPVLCVVGDRDPLFPPASIRAVADALPDARVTEIAGCGHSPYFEDPEVWNLVVERFLAAVGRPQ